MKKILSIIIVILITMLSGCELIGLSKIAIASNNMDKLESYRMDMEIEVINLQTITSTIRVDGEYTEMDIEGVKMSYFEIDGLIYTVESGWLGLPVLEKDDSYEEEEYDDFSLYKDYDFEQDGDYYILTDGVSDIFEDVETLKIRIEDNYFAEIILEGSIESYETITTITFSDFNTTELDPPSYLTEEYVTDLQERSDQLGFQYIHTGGSMIIMNGTVSVVCYEDSKICEIESNYGLIEYDPIDKTLIVNQNGSPEPYEELIEEWNSDVITIEFIEFIDEIYFLSVEHLD